jgi:Domain of unknown function (DUF4845)
MTDMHGDGTMLRLRHDRSARRQRGVSVVALLLLVALVGGIGTLAVRLIPHYIDYGTIVSLVEELPADQVHKMAPSDIRTSLKKRFLINNIRDLDPGKVVKIERKRDGTTLIVDYEQREPLVYNVDLVLVFHREFHYT